MAKIILSIIFIGISIALVVGYVKPTFNDTKKIKLNTVQYDKALNKAKEIQALKRSLLARYNLFAGGENLSKLKKMLPDHVDNIHLVLDMDGLASSRGIRLSSVKIQKDIDKNTDVQTGTSAVGFNSASEVNQLFQSLVLEFSVVSTYSKFKLFLEDLEKSLRIVDLVSLKISPVHTANSNIATDIQDDSSFKENTYKFEVGIKTYWLK